MTDSWAPSASPTFSPVDLDSVLHFDVHDPQLPAAYARDGVVIIDGALSAGEVDEISRNVERYRTHMLPGVPSDWVRYVGDGVVSGMYYMERVDPYFEGLSAHPGLQGIVEAVSGVQASPMGVETFDKPAELGSPALPHQDGVYFLGTPTRIAHIWLPLDPVGPANGAMWYWPGTHRHEIGRHVPTDDPWLVQLDPELVAQLPAPRIATLSPGSVILHHDRIVHASPPNTSEASRRALAIAWQLAL
jgi:hypothetical protein